MPLCAACTGMPVGNAIPLLAVQARIIWSYPGPDMAASFGRASPNLCDHDNGFLHLTDTGAASGPT